MIAAIAHCCYLSKFKHSGVFTDLKPNDNDNDNDNDFISSQKSTVCLVDLTIKILQKE